MCVAAHQDASLRVLFKFISAKHSYTWGPKRVASHQRTNLRSIEKWPVMHAGQMNGAQRTSFWRDRAIIAELTSSLIEMLPGLRPESDVVSLELWGRSDTTTCDGSPLNVLHNNTLLLENGKRSSYLHFVAGALANKAGILGIAYQYLLTANFRRIYNSAQSSFQLGWRSRQRRSLLGKHTSAGVHIICTACSNDLIKHCF